MHSVFIDGQHGTAGLRLAEVLRRHPKIALLELPFDARRDPSARATLMQQAEIIALCLPAKALPEALALAPPGTRCLDTSNAFRGHPDWIYGLPELGAERRAAIRAAPRVANPGCFATAFILAAHPLRTHAILEPEAQLYCSALTGYSAGGKRMIAAYEAGKHHGRICALDLDHRHLPEMQRYAGLTTPPIFVPTVGTHREGMHLTVALTIDATRDAILDAFAHAYAEEPFIEIHREPTRALPPIVPADSNHAHLYVHGHPGRLLISVRLSNLMKGAAGAAVQNLNLMLDLDERTGLR